MTRSIKTWFFLILSFTVAYCAQNQKGPNVRFDQKANAKFWAKAYQDKNRLEKTMAAAKLRHKDTGASITKALPPKEELYINYYMKLSMEDKWQ